MMKKQAVFIFILLLVILPLFHNCGQQMESKGKSISASSCETDMLPVFQETYYGFFQKHNCKLCHSPQSPESKGGIPQFANNEAVLGLKVFMNVGPDRIENKLKAGHNGFNYSALESELSPNKTKWVEALQEGSCTGNAFSSSEKSIEFFKKHPTYATVNILRDEMAGWQTLSWKMDNTDSEVTDGVEIAIDVKVSADAALDNKPMNYLVSNVRVKTSKHNLRIKGIYVLLNGSTYFVTTFKKIEAELMKGPDFQPLVDESAAAIFVKATDEKYENADRWSVEVETLESF